MSAISIITSCNGSDKNDKKIGTYYYESWRGYSVPYKPHAEMSLNDTHKLITYYIANYNNEGML